MTFASLLTREIVFFGGKGGVGKTTLAAAFAIHSAEGGARTLLVSTDPAHSTGDILEAALGAEPRTVLKDLWALEIDPTVEADRYIADVKERIVQSTPPRLLDEVERQIDIARLTPGAEESALFERFARIIQNERDRYDRIVFDTAPLGHTLRLLALPEQMQTWMTALIGRRKKVSALGRMWRNVAGAAAGDIDDRDAVLEALEARRDRFALTREVLTDARRTAFAFVLIPERLPILETGKAVRALAKYGIPIGAILVNRVLPDDAEGAFLARRRQRERTYLTRIEETFDGYPVVHVPLLDADVVGVDALRRLAASLAVVT